MSHPVSAFAQFYDFIPRGWYHYHEWLAALSSRTRDLHHSLFLSFSCHDQTLFGGGVLLKLKL